MNQTRIAEIDIADEIASNLIVRAAAVDLFEQIEKISETEVILDFKSVTFLNRSFAHEYLTQKNKSIKTISEIHLSEDAKRMMDVVFKVHSDEFSKISFGSSNAANP